MSIEDKVINTIIKLIRLHKVEINGTNLKNYNYKYSVLHPDSFIDYLEKHRDAIIAKARALESDIDLEKCCKWKYISDDYIAKWKVECKEKIVGFAIAVPDMNIWNFCPYCGKKIKEVNND